MSEREGEREEETWSQEEILRKDAARLMKLAQGPLAGPWTDHSLSQDKHSNAILLREPLGSTQTKKQTLWPRRKKKRLMTIL